MPELIHNRVRNATTLPDRYCAAAAPESMAVYLDDWNEAYKTLGRRLAELRRMHAERVAAKERGYWPPAPPLPEGSGQ